jgi:hypothetical protein
MYKKMCHRIVATVVIAVALTLAIVVSVFPQKGLTFIMFASRFFDVMLPALAVGALIKYLICGCACCKKDDESCK